MNDVNVLVLAPGLRPAWGVAPAQAWLQRRDGQMWERSDHIIIANH